MLNVEWALKMQSDIYFSIHMVTFEQLHSEKTTRIDWDGALIQHIHTRLYRYLWGTFTLSDKAVKVQLLNKKDCRK